MHKVKRSKYICTSRLCSLKRKPFICEANCKKGFIWLGLFSPDWAADGTGIFQDDNDRIHQV